MKKTLGLLLGLSISLFISAQNELEKSFDRGDFIKINQRLDKDFTKDNMSEIYYHLVKAYTYNAMNNYTKSNDNLRFLLEKKESREYPHAMIVILSLKANNYARLFDYHNAANTYKEIIDNYADILGKQISGVKESLRMYNILKDIKPLSVSIKDTQIPMIRNPKGYLEVEVQTSSKEPVLLVFDTGAGFSSVTESTAREMNLKILADSFQVSGSTNNLEYTKIAVADQLQMGNMMYENVIFQVLKDELLEVPEENIKIKGVLGFHEISALPAMKIYNKTNILEILPAKKHSESSNMMFTRDWQMIVSANDSLLLFLDTGAAWSSLSLNYYNSNKNDIENTGTSSTKLVRGMGGSKEFPIYSLTDFPVKINTSTTILPEIPVFVQPKSANQNEYDGILGQDIINQYDYMLLNFKNMYFSLGNIE